MADRVLEIYGAEGGVEIEIQHGPTSDTPGEVIDTVFLNRAEAQRIAIGIFSALAGQVPR